MTAITALRIDQVLQEAVESGTVPHVAAVAADRSGPIYAGAAGPRAAGGSDPVGPDTTFRIASMTKLIATTAALQLVEQDRLDLDAPVEHYLPEFARVQVLDGFDGDTPRLRPPAGQATVRQLITHTSGLSYWFCNADIVRWQDATGTPTATSGRMSIFDAPLVADPGTRFEYGIGIDWLGRVVEAVSEQSLAAYLSERVLQPLGMERTAFLIGAEQRAELAPLHLRGSDGSWTPTGIDWSQAPEWWSGGHGLYSTPRDYLRFQRMLLAGGSLDGARILAPETVDAAFTNQIGALAFPPALPTADPKSSADFNVGPGFKFGLGLLLNTERQPDRRAAGSGAWAGMFNTHFWVDRRTGVTGALYTQTLPFGEPGALRVYVDFERALYASL